VQSNHKAGWPNLTNHLAGWLHHIHKWHPQAGVLGLLLAALTSAMPFEIAAKSADYARYSHSQGPTFYARTVVSD
jgi:hypothetical protein